MDEDIIKEIEREGKKPKNKNAFYGIFAVILALLSKAKFLIVFLKLGKFAATLGSMLITIWIYAVTYGWFFGVGFVMLIMFHEMGHFYMAKREKLDVSTPLFIPFVGAVISMKEIPRSVLTESKIALGGPVAGTIASAFCLVLYYFSKNHMFIALAYTGFFMNLFNLIPISPLDGGRIVSIVSNKIWYIGIPILAFVYIKNFNPIILIVLLSGIRQLYLEWKDPNFKYYHSTFMQKLAFGSIYFGLVIILGISTVLLHTK